MWALLWLNLAYRATERSERKRLLLGDRLLDAIRTRWDTSRRDEHARHSTGLLERRQARPG